MLPAPCFSLATDRSQTVQSIYKEVEKLPTREREVLILRYGLGGLKEEQTLESIGKKINLTRERVRQVEKKALDRLRRFPRNQSLIKAVEDARPVIWATLSGNTKFAESTEFLANFNLLPGEIRLAMDCIYKEATDWFDKNAIRFRSGWIASDVCSEDLRTVLAELDKAKSLLLPRSLTYLSQILGKEIGLLKLAASVSRTVIVFLEYVDCRPLSARKRRRLLVYKLLDELAGPVRVTDLESLYNSTHPDDVCTSRDLDIVLSSAPHLFLQLGDLGWISLSAILEARSNTSRKPPAIPSPPHVHAGKPQSTSLTGTIRRLLQTKGPLPFVVIRGELRKGDFKNSSQGSLGPILLNTSFFVRLAPGFYGLREHLSTIDPHTTWSEHLLHPSHCRLYVMARHAGCELHYYPYWTEAMEFKLCEWAQRYADPDLYESCLAVSNPGTWPISLGERTTWLGRKQAHGRYQLASPHKHPLSSYIPPLKSLLAASITARECGYLNWIAINRATSERLDYQGSVAILALLVAYGALLPPLHWQQVHLPGPRLSNLIDQLTSFLYDKGTLGWFEDIGARILLEIEEMQQTGAGWFSKDALDLLIANLRDPQSKNLDSFEEHSDSITFDDLLMTVRRKVIQRKVRAALASI